METPLHIAARIPGADDCVEMLIKCGADVNNYREVGILLTYVEAILFSFPPAHLAILSNQPPSS